MSRLGLAAPASKERLKARVALDGPSGAGKTWSALEWATVLADGGRVLVVDTEFGSAALYADAFEFETLRWEPPYDPQELAVTIRDAGDEYGCIVLDSLSHFWEGEGGTRDIVDAAAERARGNTFAGWKVGTPALRHLIDSILASPTHIVATMRSKMEYVLEERNGKQVPKKVGMAPVMRAGIEYEFTLVGDIDLEHRILITKSRCPIMADRMIQPGRAADAASEFKAWLDSGVEPSARPVRALDAKTEVLAACAGDRDLAGEEWSQWFDGDPRSVARADLDALLAHLAGATKEATDDLG